MAEYGDLRGPLEKLIQLLKAIERHTGCIACAEEGILPSPVTEITTSGVGSSVPAGLTSVAIIKTNSTGTVNITMSDSTVYPLTTQGEGISDDASNGTILPAYTISSPDGGTWKWHGINS